MAAAQIADILPALPLDSIFQGDALSVLRTLPDNSVDAIVTDPPAGISFMGKHWDSDKGGRDAWIAWLAEVMREAWRVVKPGGHALVWALPRTSHWTAMALEDAGWEIRERIAHINGQGFPKSLDVGKAIDRMAGALREEIWYDRYHDGGTRQRQAAPHQHIPLADGRNGNYRTVPATDAARAWDGWGTALKPAVEDWWLVRKPLSEKNVAANVLRWGTGALNIGASRVESGRDYHDLTVTQGVGGPPTSYNPRSAPRQFTPASGRWPATLLLSHAPECGERGCSLWCPVRALDAQSGITPRGGQVKPYTKRHVNVSSYSIKGNMTYESGPRDTGGASRYFTTFAYVPKASRAERNRGCLALSSKAVHRYGAGLVQGQHPEAPVIEKNSHPTVKPLALMSWLIGLITPPGGIVLDPFAGSGSTLCAAKAGGWRYIGIEKEPEYVAIAEARLCAHTSRHGGGV